MLRNILTLVSELAALGKLLADPDVDVADKIRAAVPVLKALAAITPNMVDDQAVALVERLVNSHQFDDVVQAVIRLLNGQPLAFADGQPSEAEQAALVLSLVLVP